MHRESISTSMAPQAIGPYSQAIKVNGLVFVSGQLPLDAVSGDLIIGDVREATRKVIENIQHILEAAGSSLHKVVKTTVFLSDMGSFAEMNAAYAEFFGESLPARVTVEVSRLPKDVDVEIDAVAVI